MDVETILRDGFPEPVTPGLPRIVRSLDEVPVGIIDRRWVLFCDANTRRIADELVQTTKPGAATTHEILGTEPTVLTTQIVGRALTILDSSEEPLLVGVGSGSIADLTRLVASRCRLPYLLLPTAASVDGFTSSVAPVAVDGLKQTFSAAPPNAILLDPKVLATAPEALTRAGYGDLRGKITSVLDWRLAHTLHGERYRPDVANAVLKGLASAQVAYAAHAKWTADSAAVLFNALAVSGFAINAVGTSRPASGSEHHISHYLESLHLAGGLPHYFHGETVAVGTHLSLQLYAFARARDLDGVPKLDTMESLSPEPGPDVASLLAKIDPTVVRKTLLEARHVRPRFTILDHLQDRGLLEIAVETVVSPYDS